MEPDATGVDVDLVRRRVLGGLGAHRVSGQVSIGRPEVLRLTPDIPGVPVDLLPLLVREADDHHYYRVALSCTFRKSDAPVVRAVLSVALRQAQRPGVDPPVVRSMDPLRLTTPRTGHRTVRLGARGGFLPDASVEVVRDLTAERPHVVAEGVGESQVEWVFTGNSAVALTGPHQVSLIARTSAHLTCSAHLMLSAERRERWLLVPYRATIPPDIATIRLAGS